MHEPTATMEQPAPSETAWAPPTSDATQDFEHPILMLCAEKVVALLPARAAALLVANHASASPVCVASAGDPPLASLGGEDVRWHVAPPSPLLATLDDIWWAQGPGQVAQVAVPLRIGGRTVGALVAEGDAVGAAGSERLKRRLRHLADLCAASFGLVTQSARTARNAQRALALEEILRELDVPLPLERTLDTILKRGLELVPCDLAFIALHDPERAELVIAAVLGALHPRFRGARVPVGEGLSGMVFAARRPLHVLDYGSDARVKDSKLRHLVDAEGLRSLLGVPIIATQETLGILCVSRRRATPFGEDDARLLQGFAYHAGVALERLRLSERERQAIGALAEANQTLQRQYALLERMTTIHTRLTQVILEGGSLEGIVRTLAEVLGCAVAVAAPSLQTLAHAAAGDAAAAEAMSVAKSVEAFLDPAVLDNLRQLRRVVSLPSAPEVGHEAFYAVAPIVAGEELLGYLCAACQKHSFGDPELQALAHGAAAAALELLRQRARYEGQLHAQADLLTDLIAGDYQSDGEVKHRALGLGYGLDRRHVLLVVDVDALSEHVRSRRVDERSVQQLKQALLATVRQALEDQGLRGLLLARSDSVVLAVPLSEKREVDPRQFARGLAECIQQAAAPRLLGASLSVGIGRLCAKPADFQQAYQDAQRALSVAKASGRRGCVLSYTDLRMYRALFAAKDPATLRGVTEELLGPLLAVGKTKGDMLLQTLEAFLRHNGLLKATADALHLHPHSLRYRLGRIEGLLGVDLADAETRLHLHLALRVHRFLQSGTL
ncbi:MAG: GAF domain-containing protein [Chloroflexi bacterium]|nr:GAF domain-containing protein [Chloroflexota bacterium]